MAGLVCYYNTGHWIYLHMMGHEDEQSKFLQIIYCDNFSMEEILEEPIDISNQQRIYLKVHFNRANLQCYYATKANEWQKVGGILDGSILSDDYVREGGQQYRAAFTGAFAGSEAAWLWTRRVPAEPCDGWCCHRQIECLSVA